MEKKLIEYIREEFQANYMDVNDFLRDLMYIPPERNMEILAKMLLIIESKEITEIK